MAVSSRFWPFRIVVFSVWLLAGALSMVRWRAVAARRRDSTAPLEKRLVTLGAKGSSDFFKRQQHTATGGDRTARDGQASDLHANREELC